jgi:CRISPR type III-associated protein (TIGR04423 family)
MKSLSDINIDASYVGYIWLSNSSKPITSDFDLSAYNDNSNPFVVEGQLYSETKQLSYSIKYVDGKHIVSEYDLKNMLREYDEKKFIPHRIDGVSKILFRQYWEPEKDKDDLCAGMSVLVPAAFVFVGFEN